MLIKLLLKATALVFTLHVIILLAIAREIAVEIILAWLDKDERL